METDKSHPDWQFLTGNHPGKRDKVDSPYPRGSKPGDPKPRSFTINNLINFAIDAERFGVSIEELMRRKKL